MAKGLTSEDHAGIGNSSPRIERNRTEEISTIGLVVKLALVIAVITAIILRHDHPVTRFLVQSSFNNCRGYNRRASVSRAKDRPFE